MDKKSPLKPRSVLGRGLSALLSDAADLPENKPNPTCFDEIPLHEIQANPYQPRTDFDQEQLYELAESIRQHGIIQPITVRRLEPRVYQLISGERRLQASKIAGLTKIPAFIREANDQEILEMALIENIQRQDLNPIEIALSYQRLIAECNLKQEELAERVGKKRTTVANYIRLLKLPPTIQIALRDGTISMGHARALINIENIDLQLAIFQKAISEQWSVRQIEDAVRKLSTNNSAVSKNASPQNTQPDEIRILQQKLSSCMGTQVKIKIKGENRGEISIPYSSIEELNRILEIFPI
ncbi:MAG: ParB/RepB/Spo0J family partition protein [Cytophagales bacterium]|nr:ParB/RepB/Spo0J family partition protein [Cytophagales bacterium]MDW8384024.1 ParB/RepB/Spo0J family partition protein [Flammeovirgaceae bacterium]